MADDMPPSRFAALTAPYSNIMSMRSAIVAPIEDVFLPSITRSRIAPSALWPIAVLGLSPPPHTVYDESRSE